MSIVFGKSEDESREEKEAHKMHSKADPTKAINEAQPGMLLHSLQKDENGSADTSLAAWSHEQSTMESLRAVQHKDMNGNIISKDRCGHNREQRY